MFVAKNIQTDHKDLIHDVSYDFHGRRMATCSSDQYVKIWDLIGNEWKCVASTKGHAGSIWHVTWAHPEFGQVIATCSYDRTALIWEVLPKDNEDGCHLLVRGHLVDSRTSVTDVKFAPKYLGLQLAMCSADGCVRIYEAPDVMNLSQWTLQHEIPGRLSCSCLSWNQSRLQPPMIAVGSDDSSPANGGKVQIYEYVDSARKWSKVESIVSITDSVRDVAFSPCLGRSYSLLAIASKDVVIISLKPVLKKESLTNAPSVSKYELRQVAQFADHGSQVWRVSWNVTGTILASSGDDGHVRLWKANYLDNWKCIADLCDGSSRTLSPLSYEVNFDAPAGKSVNR